MRIVKPILIVDAEKEKKQNTAEAFLLFSMRYRIECRS